MPTMWETYPIDFRGGWITNQSRLEQGTNAPGSATTLINFEPSVDGGYERVAGYSKFSTSEVSGTGPIIGVFVASQTKALVLRANKYHVSSGTTWSEKATAATAGAVKAVGARYNFNGTEKIMVVDGLNRPAIYSSADDTVVFDGSAPTDAIGASLVTVFKNHIFLAKGRNLVFLAPFTDTDYATGNGAGIINTGGEITGLVVFRDTLIVFNANKIWRLVGNTEADFVLQPIADNMGCLSPYTIQEVGGDIMYLGPDGVRWLSATERNNDFALERASTNIQNQIEPLLNSSAVFSSFTLRSKNQYRLFAYFDNVPKAASQGFCATVFSDQSTSGIEWGALRGIKVYSGESRQFKDREIILFSSDDGFIYRMESGISFDGVAIPFVFETPYMPITDPRLRKTWYKHTLYVKGLGRLNLSCQMKLDYAAREIIQPLPFDIIDGDTDTAYYNEAIYGTSRYSTRTSSVFTNNLVGSGFNVAFRYSGQSISPPFLMENMILEFAQNERR